VRPRVVICLEQGCGNLTQYPPRCDIHTERFAIRTLPKPYYGHAWQKFSKAMREAQPWCTRCGSTGDLTVDHILPGSGDGGYQVLCRRCNSAKSLQDHRL